MATAGGLDIHMELTHAPERAPAVAPAAAGAVAAGGVAVAQRVHGAPRVPMTLGVERPRRQPTLTATPFVALAIVALLIAGVASAVVRRNADTPLAAVLASSTTTAGAKTAHVSTMIKADSGPLANGLTVEGGFDFDTKRAVLDIDGAQVGAPELGKIQTIADYDGGLTMYMKVPAALQGELGGKQWLKMDVGALMRQAGVDIDLGSLFQGQSNDPTQGLGMLRGADDVAKVGPETIRGVETTHYKVDLSLDKAIADAPTPEARDAMQKLSNLYTVRKLPVDVWLDSDGRVRQFQESLDTSVIRLPDGLRTQGNPLSGHVTVTYDLFDFGRPVDVTLPPASQTADLDQLLNSAGK